MNHRAAVWSFIAISLVVVLAMPVVNLQEEDARTYAHRLVSKQDTERLSRLLFNGDALVGLASRLMWRAGLSTSPDEVVVGKDGWLFLGDRHHNNTTAQRYGESERDVKNSEAMGENLIAWNRWLRAQGVKGFVLNIGPDKQSVYTPHLPDWAWLGRPSRLRALVGGSAAALIADPTADLIAASRAGGAPTYYRTDTHWTMWGGALSLDVMRRTLEAQGISLQWPLDIPPVVETIEQRPGGDLARFLKARSVFTEQEPLVRINLNQRPQSDIHELGTGVPLEPRDHGQLQYPRHVVRVVTPQASNALKVLWVRDSFGIAQSPFMAATFRETIQLHWDRALTDQAKLLVELVREQKPDLVIMTVVERVMPGGLFLTPPPQN